MVTSSHTLQARNCYDANDKIIAIFGTLGEVVNSVDTRHSKGKDLTNSVELFPMADRLIREASDATGKIHEAYVNYIERDDAAAAAAAVPVIERETWRIFNEIKAVIMEAKKLSVNPETNNLRRLESTPYDDIQPDQSHVNAYTSRHNHDTFRKPRRSEKTAIFEQARKLGPEHGSNFLLAVEDTFLAAITMLESLKAAGLDVNINQFPSVNGTYPEAWVEPKKPNHMNADDGVDGRVISLAKLVNRRRASAEKTMESSRGK
jgi:hypothetical protein